MFKRFVHYYKNHKLILTLDMIAAFLIAVTGIGYPIITRIMLNTWIPAGEMIQVIDGVRSEDTIEHHVLEVFSELGVMFLLRPRNSSLPALQFLLRIVETRTFPR